MSIENVVETTNHPQKDDKTVGLMVVYEAEIHALMSNVILRQYPVPTVHEIGEAARMMVALTHDLSYLAQGITEQYDAAEADATAARLTTE